MDQSAPRQSNRSATSPTGWWIAGLLQRNPDKDLAPFWNNHRLVRAADWKTAFKRATEMGQSDADVGNAAFGEGHAFIGVTDLVPIYDEFEDGAEILWEEIWPETGKEDEWLSGVYTESEMESLYENQPEANARIESSRPDHQ